MTTVDIEAIRQRAEHSDSVSLSSSASLDTWVQAVAASAADVPVLLAEIERLRGRPRVHLEAVKSELAEMKDVCTALTEARDGARADYHEACREIRRAQAERDEALREVAKLREWNSEIKAERDELSQRLLDARFGIEEGQHG